MKRAFRRKRTPSWLPELKQVLQEHNSALESIEQQANKIAIVSALSTFIATVIALGGLFLTYQLYKGTIDNGRKQIIFESLTNHKTDAIKSTTGILNAIESIIGSCGGSDLSKEEILQDLKDRADCEYCAEGQYNYYNYSFGDHIYLDTIEEEFKYFFTEIHTITPHADRLLLVADYNKKISLMELHQAIYIDNKTKSDIAEKINTTQFAVKYTESFFKEFYKEHEQLFSHEDAPFFIRKVNPGNYSFKKEPHEIEDIRTISDSIILSWFIVRNIQEIYNNLISFIYNDEYRESVTSVKELHKYTSEIKSIPFDDKICQLEYNKNIDSILQDLDNEFNKAQTREP